MEPDEPLLENAMETLVAEEAAPGSWVTTTQTSIQNLQTLMQRISQKSLKGASLLSSIAAWLRKRFMKPFQLGPMCESEKSVAQDWQCWRPKIFYFCAERVLHPVLEALVEARAADNAVASAAPSLPSGSSGPAAQPFHVPADYIDHWGPFTIAFFLPSASKKFGAAEARCPFHALGPKSRCKKYISLRSGDPAHRLEILWALRAWCNRARDCDRQRTHLGGRSLQLTGLPSHAQIAEDKFDEIPPAVIATDAELDAAGQVEVTAPRAKSACKAKAKSRAAPSRSSSPSSSASDSSSSSS